MGKSVIQIKKSAVLGKKVVYISSGIGYDMPMTNLEHKEEVVDYCIDNRVGFYEAYDILIQEKLTKLEEEISQLKSEVIETKRQQEAKLG